MKTERAMGVLAVGMAVVWAVLTAEEGGPETPTCGYLGGGVYEHCDSDPDWTALLRVSRSFDSDFKVCVRPGTTNLQAYSPGVYNWTVTNAWYGGAYFCEPGFRGTVDR